MQSISSHTPPVGMTAKILRENNESTLEIASGDRLILYTDGFTEARNGEGNMLGKEGFKEMSLRHCRCCPTDFLQKMYDDLAFYRAGEPDDDLTLVVIDVK